MVTADPASFELTHIGMLLAGNEVMDNDDGGTVRTVAHVQVYRRLFLEPASGQPEFVDVDIRDGRARQETWEDGRRIIGRRWRARTHYDPLDGHPDSRDGTTGDKLLARRGTPRRPPHPPLPDGVWAQIEAGWDTHDLARDHG